MFALDISPARYLRETLSANREDKTILSIDRFLVGAVSRMSENLPTWRREGRRGWPREYTMRFVQSVELDDNGDQMQHVTCDA